MSSLVSACRTLAAAFCLAALPTASHGQVAFNTEGGEYRVIGAVTGDQICSSLALNGYGGYLVWQDNATDGDGSGISAQRINRGLAGSYGSFRVNQAGAGDQTLPQVTLLAGGGAAVVWQSALGGSSKVYARFLQADGTFVSGDVAVSNYPSEQQITPVVTGLGDGNALVVWASSGQDGSMLGVFGQRFSPTGAKLGGEFQINQIAQYNQRTPALKTLANGTVVVAWISERDRGTSQTVSGQTYSIAGVPLFDIDLFARLYTPEGNPVGDQFKVNSSATICANPSISPAGDSFLVAWTGKANSVTVSAQLTDGWDIYSRTFSNQGIAQGDDQRVNTYTYGDQFAPKAAFVGGLQFLVWTSLAQDGDREGVVGRLLAANGTPVSREFRVNDTAVGAQMYPTIAANGGQSFLCVWSSFVGGTASFDLFGQRYAISEALAAPAAPHLSALSQTRLSAAWPELSGYTGVQYAVYLDGASTPILVDKNQWTASGLSPLSTHTVRIAYRLTDGRQSSLSDAASGTTWGEDDNFDGLPDNWQSQFWGPNSSQWPGANVDSDGDGATNLQEFLAGTDPKDAASVLRTTIVGSPQGWRLEWNTQSGCVYQVQSAGDGVAWSDVGSSRFAAGKTDSIPVPADTDIALYRVIRVR